MYARTRARVHVYILIYIHCGGTRIEGGLSESSDEKLSGSTDKVPSPFFHGLSSISFVQPCSWLSLINCNWSRPAWIFFSIEGDLTPFAITADYSRSAHKMPRIVRLELSSIFLNFFFFPINTVEASNSGCSEAGHIFDTAEKKREG